jgi:SAM-dependent methyltransferase
MQEKLESCPVCSWAFKDGEYRVVPYPAGKEKAFGNVPHSICLCEDCGLGVAVPVYNEQDLEEYYSGGDFWKNQKAEILTARGHPVPYALAQERMRLLKPFLREMKRPLSILDIGAGHGFLGMVAAGLKELRVSSYVCVEKDRALAGSLERTWAMIFQGTPLKVADNIDDVKGEFECVVLSHVLEHIADPATFIKKIIERMAHGGRLFIDVPNQDYLFKGDVFPHLLFFNITSMERLLCQSGLKIELLKTYGGDMDRSPLNKKNASGIRGLQTAFIARAKKILPEKAILQLVSSYFQMGRESGRGIWLRAIAKKLSGQAS